MAAVVLVCFLIGAALGLRFKVLALLPATGSVLAIVVAEELTRGDASWQVLISAMAVAAVLQAGFFVGSVVAATFAGGLRGQLRREPQERRPTRNLVKPIT
jgi:uncharacterized membrane protein YczE